MYFEVYKYMAREEAGFFTVPRAVQFYFAVSPVESILFRVRTTNHVQKSEGNKALYQVESIRDSENNSRPLHVLS